MLPKFLIADNSQEALDLVYVVHTEKPRCIIQCDLDGFYSNQKIYWIDPMDFCIGKMFPDTVDDSHTLNDIAYRAKTDDQKFGHS